MSSKVYRINGMTCGGCAQHVEKALYSVTGVTKVIVDLARGTATVEGNAAFEDMANRVASAGYEMMNQA
jgi:copper chaperone CopZ